MKSQKLENPPARMTWLGFESHQEIGCGWAILSLFLSDPVRVGRLYERFEEYPEFSISVWWETEGELMIEVKR